jgi:tetratricopeptide (TPR) repeat protein
MTLQIRFLFIAMVAFVLTFSPGVYAAAGRTAVDDAPERLTKAEVSQLFHEANQLFARANQAASSDPAKAGDLYQKSLLRYRKIVDQGNIENGKLYYNIGNIYFKTKDIGRAILNYKKAERYLGNDINLQKNLAFARQMRPDKIDVKQETKILSTVFFWHYDLSSKTRLFLFSGLFGLLWLFAGIRIFVKRPFFKWAAALTGALSLMFAASLGVEYLARKNTIEGVVISEESVARKGNSISYEPSFKNPLHAGTEFRVLEERGAWMRVQLPDDRTCWLPATDVELVR